MATKTITVDPVTRIEGHLRVDVEVEEVAQAPVPEGEAAPPKSYVVKNAWSSGQMFRGIERILQGRDPRDAWLFTQRFCGVCTTVHAMASIRSVENALSLPVPKNAQFIRNLIISAHSLHDHIVHFYHLSALDWVDIVSAVKADPKKTSVLAETLSDWPGNSAKQLEAVRARLASFVQKGQLGPFANGYWGHPAMKLPPEVNLLAASHYLQALDAQRTPNKVVALLGGKTPNIQNVAVGGVANAINLDSHAALNMTKLYEVKSLLEKSLDFIYNVYLLDVCAVGAFYLDWTAYGAGVKNYLSVPDLPLDEMGTQFAMPGGTIMGGDLGSYAPIERFGDERFGKNVSESIAHAWYDGKWTKHPYEEDTVPKPGDFDPKGKYSWVKAPRFGGQPMQVGPLANILACIAAKHPTTMKYVTRALGVVNTVAKLVNPGHEEIGVPGLLGAVHSTIGRHLARALRCAVMAELALEQWQLLVNNIATGDNKTFNVPTFPKGEISGFGFHEAPRGALSHWIVINDGKIKNYQAVVPSTWNAGPRDEAGSLGPYEASLIGNPVADPARPLEVLRTIHSFDPCLACAIHTLDPEGRELGSVETLG